MPFFVPEGRVRRCNTKHKNVTYQNKEAEARIIKANKKTVPKGGKACRKKVRTEGLKMWKN